MANCWFSLRLFDSQRYKKTEYDGKTVAFLDLKKRKIEHFGAKKVLRGPKFW